MTEYTDAELLAMLRTCESRHGTCTTTVFDNDDDFCASSTVTKRFDGWSEARAQAGLEPKESASTKRYTDEEMLDMLTTCKERHGECSPRVFDADDDFCTVSSVMRRFGSWTAAKERAGIDEDLSSKGGRKKTYSDAQILSHIRECARRNGKATTALLDDEDDLVASSVAIERFESWSDAKAKAGLEPDERAHNSRPREYTDEEYLQLLRECAEKHGRATQRVFDDDDAFPSAGAVRKRFGEWSHAKELAGLTVGKQRQYTTEELLAMLRECQDRHGKCTARAFASDGDFCSPETVQRAFGSWSDAKCKAGLGT